MAASSLTAAPALKRWYWSLHRRAARRRRDASLRANLARLRDLARRLPPQTPSQVEIDGLQLAFDDARSLYMEFKHIFAWGIYDFESAADRPRVLDCGGHIGLSALRVKRLHPQARVTVFEPDPRVLPMLRRNLSVNGAADVEIVCAALAAAAGEGRFLPDGSDGGALVPEYVAGGGHVPTVALSDFLDEPVDFLKMNIEGAELPVLCEAASKLHRVVQLAVEYHGFPHTGQVLHELLALLHDRGFRYAIHHFDHETNPALRPPFRIEETTRFFELVTAKRLWEARPIPGAAGPRDVADQRPVDEPPQPLGRVFGHDRGWPIDRCYIESFLERHAAHIRGAVLEIGESTYTRRFGGSRVTRSEVLHVEPGAAATIIGDLTSCPQIPDASLDCVILTQTLPFIFDVRAALATCRRILRPGGSLLVTVPGISQRSAFDAARWGDYWRFTPQSVARLLREAFGNASVETFGNVRSATALLEGRAAGELSAIERDHVDPDYPVIIGAVAVRDGGGEGAAP